jgi:hypothetical protein
MLKYKLHTGIYSTWWEIDPFANLLLHPLYLLVFKFLFLWLKSLDSKTTKVVFSPFETLLLLQCGYCFQYISKIWPRWALSTDTMLMRFFTNIDNRYLTYTHIKTNTSIHWHDIIRLQIIMLTNTGKIIYSQENKNFLIYVSVCYYNFHAHAFSHKWLYI